MHTLRNGVVMVRWDVARAPTSVQLLSRLGSDHGGSAAARMAGTGLTEEGLRDPDCAVTALRSIVAHRDRRRAALRRPDLRVLPHLGARWQPDAAAGPRDAERPGRGAGSRRRRRADSGVHGAAS